MRKRRLLRRSLTFLVAGVLINIALSLTIALDPQLFVPSGYRMPWRLRRDVLTDDGWWTTLIAHLPGCLMIRQESLQMERQWHWLPPASLSEYESALPRWSVFRTREPLIEYFEAHPPIDDRVIYLEQATGWPQFAVVYRYRRPIDLVRIPLPGRILPGGFALNSIVFAVAAALLWMLGDGTYRLGAVLFDFRRWRRGRRLARGLCPECCYPIGASPCCSECGHHFDGEERHAGARHRR